MACSKRKQWSDESMAAAISSIQDENKGLREAARLYNIPVETLRRHASGSVQPGCRPGPCTILNEEEEDILANYIIKMADMGFGLSRDTIMELAYEIAERLKKDHHFKDGKAGRAWFEGFRRRPPRLTFRTPQLLSYCRALCTNQDTINDFFGKLGAIYGRLNLISKPMAIFNSDETGVSVVHKPGKVVAELGRRNVYSLTSAERGKTHTVLSCVSASGFVLPPMIVYPRKQRVPNSHREGAVPGTLFVSSESGWINTELYLEWFKFFLKEIPPSRPVLLIQDGHSSHVSIQLIELARENDVHLLCLPAHTTHVLQPLDVGVFKSFKANFSKACSKYLAKHPGRVITTDKLASLIGIAWPNSLTSVNIMSGFKKTGVYPLNPGEVSDRQLAPSKAVRPCQKESEGVNQPEIPLFTSEQEALYQKRYEEKYNIPDPDYVAWLKLNHPEEASETFSETDMPASSISSKPDLESGASDSIAGSLAHKSLPFDTGSLAFKSQPSDTGSLAHKSQPSDTGSLAHKSQSSPNSLEFTTAQSQTKTSDILSEILVLPKPKKKGGRKTKTALTQKALCITDHEVLEMLKTKEEEKKKNEEMKVAKRLEKEQKKQEREKLKEQKKLEKEKKQQQKLEKQRLKEQKKLEREKKKEQKKLERDKVQKRKSKRASKKPTSKMESDEVSIQDVFSALRISSSTSSSDESDAESDAVCPKCGLTYSSDDGVWICCDNCNKWFDLKCTKFKGRKKLPETYYCEDCV